MELKEGPRRVFGIRTLPGNQGKCYHSIWWPHLQSMEEAFRGQLDSQSFMHMRWQQINSKNCPLAPFVQETQHDRQKHVYVSDSHKDTRWTTDVYVDVCLNDMLCSP